MSPAIKSGDLHPTGFNIRASRHPRILPRQHSPSVSTCCHGARLEDPQAARRAHLLREKPPCYRSSPNRNPSSTSSPVLAFAWPRKTIDRRGKRLLKIFHGMDGLSSPRFCEKSANLVINFFGSCSGGGVFFVHAWSNCQCALGYGDQLICHVFECVLHQWLFTQKLERVHVD